MIRLFILILVQGLLVIGSECFLKVALSKTGDFSWTWAFFKEALSTWEFYAAGLTAISFILSLFAGALIFHEAIPPTRWIGVVLIMAGAYFVAR